LKIMNLVILMNSAQMFFLNFGLAHVNAALGFAIGLAAPNGGPKIIARLATPVEWLRSPLLLEVPEPSRHKLRDRLRSAAEVSVPPITDCCAGRRIWHTRFSQLSL
jgi:hypothetical protein